MTTSELHLPALQVGGIILVRCGGVLDLSTYVHFRDSLLKHAADEPTALIVELDGDFEFGSTAIASVLSTVWMRVSEWPGVPVLVVATADRHRDTLVTSGVGRFVPYFSSLQAALDAVGKPPRRRLDRMTLPSTPGAGRYARDFARTTCVRWRLDSIADAAADVVGELVDNVVRHTASGPAIRLELRGERLTVAVGDLEPRLPKANDTHRPHGLGIVEALSHNWGSTPAWSGGKTVWAVLETPGGTRPVSPNVDHDDDDAG